LSYSESILPLLFFFDGSFAQFGHTACFALPKCLYENSRHMELPEFLLSQNQVVDIPLGRAQIHPLLAVICVPAFE